MGKWTDRKEKDRENGNSNKETEPKLDMGGGEKCLASRALNRGKGRDGSWFPTEYWPGNENGRAQRLGKET